MRNAIPALLILSMVASRCPGQEESAARDPLTVELWPRGVPGEVTDQEEHELPDRGDGVRRLTCVSRPRITIHRPKQAEESTPAVLICPGGGYRILAIDKCGTEIAEWLSSIGITAAVLRYRVPDNRAGAFQDAQRAMGLLRENARTWGIDPQRIGVIGFSAGGHLAARLSTDFTRRSYPRVDAADARSSRPDFAILVYPAYLFRKGERYELPDEIAVTGETPQAFLVQAQDDRAYVDSSIAYYLALKSAGVPAELHLYPTGGHGGGLRPSKHAFSQWPRLCERWLRDSDLLRDRR